MKVIKVARSKRSDSTKFGGKFPYTMVMRREVPPVPSRQGMKPVPENPEVMKQSVYKRVFPLTIPAPSTLQGEDPNKFDVDFNDLISNAFGSSSQSTDSIAPLFGELSNSEKWKEWKKHHKEVEHSVKVLDERSGQSYFEIKSPNSLCHGESNPNQIAQTTSSTKKEIRIISKDHDLALPAFALKSSAHSQSLGMGKNKPKHSEKNPHINPDKSHDLMNRRELLDSTEHNKTSWNNSRQSDNKKICDGIHKKRKSHRDEARIQERKNYTIPIN